jgi:hypothetical protein
MIEPDRDRAVGAGIAEREIELAQAARQQGGFRGRGFARLKTAFGGFQKPDDGAAAAHGEFCRELAVIRSRALCDAVERQFIAADRDRL